MDTEYILPGSIWSVKSRNEYENNNYLGMSFGQQKILILNYNKKQNTITYLKVGKPTCTGEKFMLLSNINSTKLYEIKLSGIYIGCVECLDKLLNALSSHTVNGILANIFDIFEIPRIPGNKCNANDKLLYNRLYINKSFEELSGDYTYIPNSITTQSKQQQLHKYGIDVYITENTNVHIDSNNKIILSDNAKEDFIYHGSTEEDRLKLCDKYLIYPEKAIREIRNRLIYRHKQKEG